MKNDQAIFAMWEILNTSILPKDWFDTTWLFMHKLQSVFN